MELVVARPYDGVTVPGTIRVLEFTPAVESSIAVDFVLIGIPEEG
jgi:hypothetical protein